VRTSTSQLPFLGRSLRLRGTRLQVVASEPVPVRTPDGVSVGTPTAPLIAVPRIFERAGYEYVIEVTLLRERVATLAGSGFASEELALQAADLELQQWSPW